MKDVAFEWYVPYIPDRKKLKLKAAMVSVVLGFLIDAVLFTIALLPMAIIWGSICFLLFRSWNYEYEYVYVNGTLDISKIIRKAKRKEIYHVDCSEIENFKEGRVTAKGCAVKDFTSGREEFPVYTIRAGNQSVYIEPDERFMEEMKKRYHTEL